MRNENKEVSTSRAVRDILKERKAELEKIVDRLEKRLASAPKGSLRVLRRKLSFQYYRREKPEDPNGTYIPKRDLGIARKLAQRDYDQRVLNTVKEELRIIDSYEYLLGNDPIERVSDHFCEGRIRLIDPISIPDAQYMDLWQNEEYEHFAFAEDANQFYSVNGIRVRSKSEVIIANLLEHYGVFYKYEYPLTLGRTAVRPDFICLNARTRKEYIWEHFGMMDDSEYANRNMKKIFLYEQNGYHAGENMILTFESSQVPLSSNIIKHKIEHYLI